MKKIAILQSNYIPWKGYFDIINYVDEFIIYDSMQYTRRDWRNRNIIKTANGPLWLTIPVDTKGKYLQKINETRVSDHSWAKKHWDTIRMTYAKAPFFNDYKDVFEDLYSKAEKEELLSNINYMFLSSLCEMLGIKTKLTIDTDYEAHGKKTERLVSLVQSAGGDFYLSGPAAKDYIVNELFDEAGIELQYMDYSGYPEYKQLYGDFLGTVSVIDLLFMTGSDAPSYMKSFRSEI